ELRSRQLVPGHRRLSRIRGPGASLRRPAGRRIRAAGVERGVDAAAGPRRARPGRVAPGGCDRPSRHGAGRGRVVKRTGGWSLLAPALLLLVVAFVVPVGMLVPSSVHRYVPLLGITSEFTLAYYVRLVTDSYYLEIIGRTLALGAVVTLATLVIGYP